MLKGLEEVEKELRRLAIPFHLIPGLPEKEVPAFVQQRGVGTLITDFDPLRIKRDWKRAVACRIDIPLLEVDTRNIVPCWVASPKQEYGAYTFRPKIKRALPDYLEDFPKTRNHPFPWRKRWDIPDWQALSRTLQVDSHVGEVGWIQPGEKAARKALGDFLKKRLPLYDSQRNDPTKHGQSNLSPYLHFGQISAQRVALEVSRSKGGEQAKEAFLEELIVRRELSDNFCFYNENYDSVEGFPNWAKESLDKHRKEPRPYVYPLEAFEDAQTHDDLWNAAQKQMVNTGKMHGYMRMYWGKKILEWTQSPEEAMRIANYLNDRYELDGRETNGYVGVAWCIGGIHDRAWPERPVFGKIRYMSYNGCKSKFNVKAYIEQNTKES